MFGVIAFTTSVSVRLSAAKRPGSTATTNAGCVVPVTVTFETPGSCSITGTIVLFAIDANTGSQILDVFRDLHRGGQTIVMVTHDPRIAAAADHRVALEMGRLKE